MNTDRPDRGEGFLSRWSRVKTEAREETAARDAVPAAKPPVPPGKPDPQSEPPVLPPVEKLTIESDFSGFFHPKVEEDVRRAALHKLFSDPHFNVMDGLDVYIDDYSKGEELPAAMLASLKQAQRIFEWASEKKEPGAAETAPAAEPAAAQVPVEPPVLPQADASDVPSFQADLQPVPGKT